MSQFLALALVVLSSRFAWTQSAPPPPLVIKAAGLRGDEHA